MHDKLAVATWNVGTVLAVTWRERNTEALLRWPAAERYGKRETSEDLKKSVLFNQCSPIPERALFWKFRDFARLSFRREKMSVEHWRVRLKGEHPSTTRKIYCIATLSITNPTMTGPGSNPELVQALPTNLKFVGSIPSGSFFRFCIHVIRPGALCLWGLAQSLTEIRTRDVSWGIKAARA